MRYIWQHEDWPHFTYDLSDLQDILYLYAKETSYLSGSLDQLPDTLQNETLIDLMISEAIKTSAIEGEKLDQDQVRFSIRNQLGLSQKQELVKDPRAVGIAQLMISVRKNWNQPLRKEDLFEWHRMVIADPSQASTMEVGMWRTSADPMQIVSGALGHEKVHYEAPPSLRIEQEMEQFIAWFNRSCSDKIPGPVKAAIAHLYFECIHPFADGNGRIGRAISEKALSQDLHRPVLLSLSTQIEKNRKKYYEELSITSRGDLNIQRWVKYFTHLIYEAQLDAKKQILFIIQKAKFWTHYGSKLNERQSRVLTRMFKEGPLGFTGGISAQKYMKIADCSKATATRDLTELLAYGCLERLSGSGRSTSYALKLETTTISF
jgi:Fic family protein